MGYLGYKPADKPLTSADITDGIIVNADIANSTINLTTKVTGTLPTTNGGTGLATLGTASQVLRVNSGATALEFATPSGGKILQVVTATKTATQSHTGNGINSPEEFISIGLSASITPSSTSSRIFITSNIVVSAENASYGSIFRGTSATTLGSAISNTNLSAPTSPGSRQNCFAGDFNIGNSDQAITYSMTFVDSPSTTSERVYEIGISVANVDRFYINRTVNDTNDGFNGRGVSTLTLMEIGV
jgi:hypothetical protein